MRGGRTQGQLDAAHRTPSARGCPAQARHRPRDLLQAIPRHLPRHRHQGRLLADRRRRRRARTARDAQGAALYRGRLERGGRHLPHALRPREKALQARPRHTQRPQGLHIQARGLGRGERATLERHRLHRVGRPRLLLQAPHRARRQQARRQAAHRSTRALPGCTRRGPTRLSPLRRTALFNVDEIVHYFYWAKSRHRTDEALAMDLSPRLYTVAEIEQWKGH